MKSLPASRRATLQKDLNAHVAALHACTICPKMHRPAVSGGPVASSVMLVGQAPGDKEPKMGRPFAWTAGKMMFRWFSEHCDVDEATFRNRIYMAAVCRCFPGKRPKGGDRVPEPQEIENCSAWMEAEMRLLHPRLVIPVGKLAIHRFLPEAGKLDTLIGHRFQGSMADVTFDIIPLPHPSGASPWPRMEPGKTLVRKALQLIKKHSAWQESIAG